MSKYKVVVTDYNYPDLEIEKNILREAHAELISTQCRTEEEVIKAGANADALLNQYAPISEKVIASLAKCKVIVRYGIGLDNIDVKAATKKGITVVNVPSYCEDEVSDHALTLVLCCVRKIFHYNLQIKKGTWDWKTGKPLLGLSEQTLGDVVSLHAPLNESTKHLFSEREFDLMKSSAFMVNTARGGLIDEKALYEALANKKIAGAAVDVLGSEFPKVDNPLLQLDNLILTPHAAWYSEASLVKLRTRATKDIARALKGEIPEGLANRELIHPSASG